MGQGNQFHKTSNPTFHSLKKATTKLFQFLILSFSFVLLVGLENENPRLGDSHVDFYLEGCRNLLEINSKASLLYRAPGDKSMQVIIEDLANEFYAQRDYMPAWTINYKGTENLKNLIQLLDSSLYFGLPETIINSSSLQNILHALEKNAFDDQKLDKRIKLELEATKEAILLMIYLNRGIIKTDTSVAFTSFANGLPEILDTSINKSTVVETLLAQQPEIDMYTGLVNALPLYLDALKNISAATDGIARPTLAQVLFYNGILDKPQFDSINTIENSITKFQKKNKLALTGFLNTETVRTMEANLDERYHLVALNLDRLRKANVVSGNYLFVNIPEYKLRVYHNSSKAHTFKVVVGKRHTPTPVLSSYLDKIITNPYWTVPKSIVRNEMLTKIRTDSTFLERNRYFIINGLENEVDESTVDWTEEDPLGKRYWIRQENGSGNALGKVKFVFPNNYRVYLHDTPSKRFFNKKKRAYSHGCVRVQNPDQLAQYLSDTYYAPNNDSINIGKEIARRKRTILNISEKVEIHIQYITCSAVNKQELIFHNDVYKRDSRELSELFEWQKAI